MASKPVSAGASSDLGGGCSSGQGSSAADSSGNNFGGGSKQLLPVIKRAAALREKYKRGTDSMVVPVEQVGFHPANRNNVPPNGSRCNSLCDEILEIGFDIEEANTFGVVVAEGPGLTTFLDYNKQACAQDEYLVDVNGSYLGYASLSHSHLNQILKNIKLGGVGKVTKITRGDGRLSAEMLRELDESFYRAVMTGLKWEILEYAIMTEEPEACECIQAALSSKNGLYMMAHEMQALSQLALWTSVSSNSERRMSFLVARQKLVKPCHSLQRMSILCTCFISSLTSVEVRRRFSAT